MEGVEIREQAAFLLEQGCDEMQAYLVGAPAPPWEITRMLETFGRPN